MMSVREIQITLLSICSSQSIDIAGNDDSKLAFFAKKHQAPEYE